MKLPYTSSSTQRKRDVLRWLLPSIMTFGLIFGAVTFMITDDPRWASKVGAFASGLLSFVVGSILVGASFVGGTGGDR